MNNTGSNKYTAGLKHYLVGGAVRDKLLGVSGSDRDWVVVGSSDEQMIERGFKRVGHSFPVFLHPRSGEEYALARTERKTAKGYQGFSFDTSSEVSLEQDLQRRDLTINAMAEDEDGTLIDPFNGQEDLRRGILRHVSKAFLEDPVRLLRVARFAARFDFQVAAESMELMRKMVQNGEVDSLVAERVWAELEKALAAPHPHRFIEVLRESGALGRIFPELDALFGIPQTAKYHPEIDTGVHTLMVMQQAAALSQDPIVRFASLVHDFGKAGTDKSLLPSHKGHEKRGLPIIATFCRRLRVPKRYQSLALAVSEYHLHMHKMLELRASTVLKMLEQTGCFNQPGRAQQIALCCLADARGRQGFEQAEYPQAQRFLDYFEAASTIEIEEIVKQHQGEAIKIAIAEKRREAIQQLKSRS